jgi:hypothetical protein
MLVMLHRMKTVFDITLQLRGNPISGSQLLSLRHPRLSDSNTATSGVEGGLWLAMLALQKRVLHNLGFWKRAVDSGKGKKDYTVRSGRAVPAWVRLRG